MEKNYLKFFMSLLIGVLMLIPANASAENENPDVPVIKLKTTGKTLRFYVSSNTGPGDLKVDFGDGKPATFIVGMKDTVTIQGAVVPGAEIKVYGSKSLITYFYSTGNLLTSADFSGCESLVYLVIPHNSIETLNLTGNKQLGFLDCSVNSIASLNLSGNGNLVYLYAYGNPNLGNVDFSANPYIHSIVTYSCPKITNIDVTKNTNLQRLSIDGTSVTSVDVTNNPDLRILNLSSTSVRAVDVTKNPRLRELYVVKTTGKNYLSTLDVSNNPELTRLFCTDNNLDSLDITRNPSLLSLFAAGNNLKRIDISQNPNLGELMLQNNCFTPNQLPSASKYSKIKYYSFTPQKPHRLNQKEYATGSMLDLSQEVYNPNFKIKADLILTDSEDPKKEQILKEGEDYTHENGKITFLKAQPDSVICNVLHADFPNLFWQTRGFMVLATENMGKPSLAFEFATEKQAGETVSMKMAAMVNDSKVKVDFGNGELTEFNLKNVISTYGGTIKGELKGDTVKVYSIDGTQIKILQLPDLKISHLNIRKLYALKELVANKNLLDEINFSTNRYLEDVNLSDNKLVKLDLTNKMMLTKLQVEENLLESLSLERSNALKTLYCSRNKLSMLNMTGKEKLETLQCTHNNLTKLDFLSHCTGLKTMWLTSNRLETLDCSQNTNLTTLGVIDNHFKFSTLPITTAKSFVYNQQKVIGIPKSAKIADLSSEAIIKEQPTVYVWKTKDGRKLFENDDYTVNNGITTFPDADMDSVYCEMTNKSWPGLTLKTSCIKPADLPTLLLAELETTDESGKAIELRLAMKVPGYIYVDFGNDKLKECKVETTYSVHTSVLGSSKKIKLYGYNESDYGLTVFSLRDIVLSKVDISKLTELTTLNLSGTGLKQLDISKNTKIKELMLENNRFASIDLSSHNNLTNLNLQYNKLTELNLGSQPVLNNLYCTGNKLASVDLSAFPHLRKLALGSNLLKELDIRNNPELKELYCDNNQLDNLDISHLPELTALNVRSNKFKFSNIPTIVSLSYTYAPQETVPVEVIDGKIDLRAESNISGSETAFTWKTESGTELTIGTDYSIEDGLVTFLRDSEEKVYCTMTNAIYPKLTLTTGLISIKSVSIKSESAGDNIYTRNGVIYIETEAGATVNIYDVAGRPVSTFTAQGGIMTEKLPEGICFVEIGKQGTRTQHKVMVR